MPLDSLVERGTYSIVPHVRRRPVLRMFSSHRFVLVVAEAGGSTVHRSPALLRSRHRISNGSVAAAPAVGTVPKWDNFLCSNGSDTCVSDSFVLVCSAKEFFCKRRIPFDRCTHWRLNASLVREICSRALPLEQVEP